MCVYINIYIYIYIYPETPNTSKSSRVEALVRLSRLWSPFDRRMVVAGVITRYHSDGSPFVVLDPTSRIGALSAAWADTFSAKPACRLTAEEVTARWARPLDFSGVPPLRWRTSKLPLLELALRPLVATDSPTRLGLPLATWALSLCTMFAALSCRASPCPSPSVMASWCSRPRASFLAMCLLCTGRRLTPAPSHSKTRTTKSCVGS